MGPKARKEIFVGKKYIIATDVKEVIPKLELLVLIIFAKRRMVSSNFGYAPDPVDTEIQPHFVEYNVPS